MDLTLSGELVQIPDLQRQVLDLDHFRSSFSRGTELVGRHAGVRFEIDPARVDSAFLGWIGKWTLQNSRPALDRQDLCAFACGLLLAELVRAAPVGGTYKAGQTEGGELPSQIRPIARFWPEGFLLTSYCASLLDAILQQAFGTAITVSPVASDLRTWWSFRENAQEDPATAIGFFDLFLGNEPNWQQPEAAALRSLLQGQGSRPPAAQL